MGVTVERPLGIAILSLITGKVPDDQGLVSATGEEHVGAVKSTCKLTISNDGIDGFWFFVVAAETYFSIDVAKLVTQPFCREINRQS